MPLPVSCGDFSDRGAVSVSMVFICLSQRLPSCLRQRKAHADLICNSPNEITTAQRFSGVESQRELRRNGGASANSNRAPPEVMSRTRQFKTCDPLPGNTTRAG